MSLLPRPPHRSFSLPLSSAESPAIPVQKLHIVQIQGLWSPTGSQVSILGSQLGH